MISPDGVAIAGQLGWLYLYSGSNNYYSSYLEGEGDSRAGAIRWSKAIDAYCSYANDYNSRFLAIVIPNKATILSKNYPLAIPQQITPRLASLLEGRNHVILCPYAEMSTFPYADSVYRKLDSHLTEIGNLYIARKILGALGIDESICQFKCHSFHVRHRGDLGSHFSTSPNEVVMRIRYEDEGNIEFRQISRPVSDHTGLIYEAVNKGAPLGSTLAVFGNSFFDRPNGWGLAPFFCRIFKTVRFYWESGVYEEYIADCKPDYILFQTCERFLARAPRDMPFSLEYLKSIKRGASMTSSSTLPALDSSTQKPYFSISTGNPSEGELYIFTHFIGNVGANEEIPLHQLAEHSELLRQYGLTLRSKDAGSIEAIDIQSFVSTYLETGLLSRLQSSISPGKWEVYSFMPDGKGSAEVIFGVVLPLELKGRSFNITCDGQDPDSVSYFYDKHLGSTHWFMPSQCVVGVKCSYSVPTDRPYLHFALNFSDPSLAEYSDKYSVVAAYTDSGMLESLPDLPRIQRVASKNANQSSFLNGGRSAFISLKAIAKKHGIPFLGEEIQILDWGVGCGRVARHFSELNNVYLTGIDIDKDNIEWCASNLRGAYKHVALNPPVDIQDQSFHLIYACSVLSHLTEVDSTRWLREMARLLRHDGLALLSYNGLSNSASYLSRRPAEFIAVEKNCLFDSDVNTELSGYIPSPTYYRASFASDQWWHDMFSKFFDIVAIEQSVVSGHQHVAVLAKKSVFT